ncbi:hypothetical protein COV15_02920 [Candidatus Woesearchaeota archaeon CG10_big_fil_rev_8_21_14_0_10_34_12]|nr:MAG: hypothetical protein COV15_02920 [Candidatus Woesearchaeota archaeon CG10_big_fil_rev_8_21_14_0_10_34_12]
MFMASESEGNSKLNNSLKLIAKTSFIVLVGLSLSKIFTYLYRIIVARYFGPEVYGVFSLALIILNLFLAAASLGLSDGILRFVSISRGKKQSKKIEHIIKFSLIASIVSSITASVILFIFSEYISITLLHNPQLISYLKIFSFMIPFSVLSNIFLSSLRAYEKINLYSFLQNILQPGIRLVFLILLIFLGIQSNPVAYSYVLSAIIFLGMAYFVFKYGLPKIFINSPMRIKERKELSRNLIRYSWPIIFTGVISSFLWWIDSLFIGYFMNVADVGIYNSAIPIVALLAIAPELFMQLFSPMINRAYSKSDFSLIRELTKQVSKWILIINLPAFILMLVFPGILINLLFGQEYIGAEFSLRVLAIGGIISSVFGICSYLLSMLGKSKLILIDLLMVSMLNILLNFLLIPGYGIGGAAIATLVCIIFLMTLLLWQSKIYLNVLPLRRKMISLIAIGLFISAISLILDKLVNATFFSLILLGMIITIVYFILLFATKSLDKNDWMILNTILNKFNLRKIFLDKFYIKKIWVIDAFSHQKSLKTS